VGWGGVGSNPRGTIISKDLCRSCSTNPQDGSDVSVGSRLVPPMYTPAEQTCGIHAFGVSYPVPGSVYRREGGAVRSKKGDCTCIE